MDRLSVIHAKLARLRERPLQFPEVGVAADRLYETLIADQSMTRYRPASIDLTASELILGLRGASLLHGKGKFVLDDPLGAIDIVDPLVRGAAWTRTAGL